MPSFHNPKEGTKTLTENSTALLQRKTPWTKSPLCVTDGETWTKNSGAWVETTGTWPENKSYLCSDQASAGSAPLLGVKAPGWMCTNICHFITSSTMLSNFQQSGQTAVIIENRRIKQQWQEEDNRIRRVYKENQRSGKNDKICRSFQVADFVVALSLFWDCFL